MKESKMSKEEIMNEDLVPLKEPNKKYKRLRMHGETALRTIAEVLEHIQKNPEEIDPLNSIEIYKRKFDAIYFKYLGIKIFIRIMHDFEKGYLEWGVFTEQNGTEVYDVIDTDMFDVLGNLNSDNSVDHAHVFIPEHLINIINNLKEKRKLEF